MDLFKIDHIAIEVHDVDSYIEKFVSTGGLRLLRRGVATRTGARIAMLGDATGTKIELIENVDQPTPMFSHLAFRVDDVDKAAGTLRNSGWSIARGPFVIDEARARSAFLGDESRFKFQIISYEKDSPDILTW